ncbi:MAG: 3-dehydroquinate synthase [Rhodospirillales bacterium]|nr:3-dehydroquinate synthase [Rhodospirillales bacterium]
MNLPRQLEVDLGARSYSILVGDGLLRRAGELMGPVLRQKRVFVVTDENVAPLYLDPLCAALDAAGISHAHCVLPAGEGTKSFPWLERLLSSMLDARCERDTTVVALGGGVIGDLAGFAASILMRGVEFVQVPTTLLSQVDSSVGGKTGINMPHGKNLVGTFHQPRLVLADTATLRTLPRRELLAGYAEVVKYGLINDPTFFDWLEANAARALAGEAEALRHAIVTSCRAKAAIVADDERESGRRALLNLGHTFAHAFEAETGYGAALLHGEAVAIGMTMAFRLSVRLGLCSPAEAERVRAHLSAVGLPVRPDINRAWDAAALIGHMASDKKTVGGRVTFVLARGIGRALLAPDVADADVAAVLEEAVAG